MRLLALLALAGALIATAPAAAAAGQVAVGISDGANADELAYLAWSATGGTVDDDLEELDALVVNVPDAAAAVAALSGLPGVDYVEPVQRSRRLAFLPNDPLVFFQWYLNAVRAFDFWEAVPVLAPVRVAVVDSGIDGSHPEFQGRVADAKSFVPGKATVDTIGHGTVVAGEIAAALDNAEGIAGVGFPVELLVAKVVSPDLYISVSAEAKAIKWAVDNGAQVINLSLGGTRDPRNPSRDTYSKLEQEAIDYAFENGVVVVAATGNCELSCPYRYASYPAALPHVLGASALNQSGRTPQFSNRDAVFNDLAAPGVGIVSTFPLDLTDQSCAWPGYNICALGANRSGDGTSFSAPLVSAAAALLLAQTPALTASQVMALLEGSAADISTPGRDSLTGNGRLDIADALSAALALPPPADRFEVNDDAGSSAHTLYGSRPRLSATIDPYDDPSDVYRVYLRAGRTVTIDLTGPPGRKPTVVLWRPGTKTVTPVTAIAVRSGAVLAYRTGRDPELRHRVTRTGWHFVQVRAPKAGGGLYELSIRK